MHTKQWHIDVFVDEEGDVTHARAVFTGDSPRTVTATGSARRNPHDPSVPEIGDELATARALEELARRLTAITYDDIEGVAPDDFRAD